MKQEAQLPWLVEEALEQVNKVDSNRLLRPAGIHPGLLRELKDETAEL